ncbi:MAG: Uma2 family endonuclease, partial [Planctomycetota bacterium]
MPLVPESRVRLTYADLLEFPSDGNRHEILDGVHYVSAAPATYHQLVSSRLHGELHVQVVVPGRAHVFSAPTDVELGAHDIVEPDLLLVSLKRAEIIHPSRIVGAPDLVIEILSPSTRRIDLGKKRERYERCGVGEYWVVDPERRVVDQYHRVD